MSAELDGLARLSFASTSYQNYCDAPPVEFFLIVIRNRGLPQLLLIVRYFIGGKGSNSEICEPDSMVGVAVFVPGWSLRFSSKVIIAREN